MPTPALEALCRRDTNLITAEATVKFLLEDIHKSQSHYHTQIMDAIDQRIVQERYTDASAVLQCLHNPSSRLAKRSVVNTFCANLLSRIRGKGIEDHEFPLNEEVSMVPGSSNPPEDIHDNDDMPLAKKLQLAIDASMRKSQEKLVQRSLSSMLKYELLVGQQTGKKRVIFRTSISNAAPATSVEAERAFFFSISMQQAKNKAK